MSAEFSKKKKKSGYFQLSVGLLLMKRLAYNSFFLVSQFQISRLSQLIPEPLAPVLAVKQFSYCTTQLTSLLSVLVISLEGK
jgi:hypothetical protein